MKNAIDKTDLSKIAILIPSYNECRYIEDVIEKCLKYNLDIVIVNDGSTDNTPEILEKLSLSYPGKLIIINHNINKGKGEALKTGFDYAVYKSYSGIITIDADGQHDVEEIKNFLEEIEKCNPDLIVGSRFDNTKGMPFIRRFVNYLTSWIISSIAGKKIADVQSGYRFLSSKVLRNIKLETKNFDTEPEILLKAGWMNYYIKNIPIKTIYHLDEFKSHVNPVKDTIKFFKLVFKSFVWKKNFLEKQNQLKNDEQHS